MFLSRQWYFTISISYIYDKSPAVWRAFYWYDPDSDTGRNAVKWVRLLCDFPHER